MSTEWLVPVDGTTHRVSVELGTNFEIPDVYVDGQPVEQHVLPPLAFAPHREHHFEMLGHKAVIYASLVDLQIRVFALEVDGKRIDD